MLLETLISSEFDTIRKIAETPPADLTKAVPGVNYYDLADKILEQIHNKRD